MCPELGSAPVTGKSAGLEEQLMGRVIKGSFPFSQRMECESKVTAFP